MQKPLSFLALDLGKLALGRRFAAINQRRAEVAVALETNLSKTKRKSANIKNLTFLDIWFCGVSNSQLAADAVGERAFFLAFLGGVGPSSAVSTMEPESSIASSKMSSISQLPVWEEESSVLPSSKMAGMA